jgi:Putative RNA methylase family UPF0020
MQLAFFLGRNPELSRQEVESVAAILPFLWTPSSVQAGILCLKPTDQAAEYTIAKNGVQSPELLKIFDNVRRLQRMLGGTLKVVWLEECVGKADVLTASQRLIEAAQSGVEGKRTIGMSAYGRGVGPFRVGMELKKALRSGGKSVRIVFPTEGDALSSAAILHNNLAGEDFAALELNIVEENGKHWIGLTIASQDLDEYTKRDFGIPFPDAVSGMLPPKLAQAMINLATRAEDVTVYDPFCGNGRIVMESYAMGRQGYGSDIVPKKVESAIGNLEWMGEHGASAHCWVQDATDSQAPYSVRNHIGAGSAFVIAAEPYLGRPLRANLKASEKETWLAELVPLYEGFMKTWAEADRDLRPRRMLVVFPRAKVDGGGEASVYDALVDTLTRFGYHHQVRHCYDRPDSFVRRDLVSIEYRS